MLRHFVLTPKKLPHLIQLLWCETVIAQQHMIIAVIELFTVIAVSQYFSDPYSVTVIFQIILIKSKIRRYYCPQILRGLFLDSVTLIQMVLSINS